MKIYSLIYFALIFKTSKNFQQEQAEFEYLNLDKQDKLFLNQSLSNLNNLNSNNKDDEQVNSQNFVIQKEDQTTSYEIINSNMKNQQRQKNDYQYNGIIDKYQIDGSNLYNQSKDYLFLKRNLQSRYYSYYYKQSYPSQNYQQVILAASQNQQSPTSSSSSSNQQSKTSRTTVCRTKNGCYTAGDIAGITIGACIGASCIGCYIFCMCYSRRQQEIQQMQNQEKVTDVQDKDMVYPEGFNPNIPPPEFPPGYGPNTDLSYLHTVMQTNDVQEGNNLIYPERLNFYNQSLPQAQLSNVELQQYSYADYQILNSASQQAGVNQQKVVPFPQVQAQGPNFYNVPQQNAYPQQTTIQIQNDEHRININQNI